MTRPFAAALLLVGACSRTPAVLEDPPSTASAVRTMASAAPAARVVPAALPTADAGMAADAGPATSKTGHVATRMRGAGVTVSSGALPQEVIERIVRQNYGRFRLCYEMGLRSDPTLAGTVRVRFVIDKDGSTGVVSDGGSDLADVDVSSCIERAAGRMTFPALEGDPMTVTFALALSPESP